MTTLRTPSSTFPVTSATVPVVPLQSTSPVSEPAMTLPAMDLFSPADNLNIDTNPAAVDNNRLSLYDSSETFVPPGVRTRNRHAWSEAQIRACEPGKWNENKRKFEPAGWSQTESRVNKVRAIADRRMAAEREVGHFRSQHPKIYAGMVSTPAVFRMHYDHAGYTTKKMLLHDNHWVFYVNEVMPRLDAILTQELSIAFARSNDQEYSIVAEPNTSVKGIIKVIKEFFHTEFRFKTLAQH